MTVTQSIIFPSISEQELARRQAIGADRYDEAWDGVYMMAPLANNEHQNVQMKLAIALCGALGEETSDTIYAGVNVSDRATDWQYNFRCPDVAVFLPGNPSINHQTHWQGGPDFLIEIVSDNDRSDQKLDFYASLGVREILFVNRKPWSLALYRSGARGDKLQHIAHVTVRDGAVVHSEILPLSFNLLSGTNRPRIQISSTGQPTRTWFA